MLNGTYTANFVVCENYFGNIAILKDRSLELALELCSKHIKMTNQKINLGIVHFNQKQPFANTNPPKDLARNERRELDYIT